MGVDRTEINAASAILAKAGIADCDASKLSPLTLAYVGDCVYEIIIRTIVVGRAEHTVNTLHKHTCRYVNAAAQRQLLFGGDILATVSHFGLVDIDAVFALDIAVDDGVVRREAEHAVLDRLPRVGHHPWAQLFHVEALHR